MQISRTGTETRTDTPYGTVTTFHASPVFTLVNDGHTDTYHAAWTQLDTWADTHHLPLEWSISDGAPMQRAIDTDHALADTITQTP